VTHRIPFDVRSAAPTVAEHPSATNPMASRPPVLDLTSFYRSLPETTEEPGAFPMFGVHSDIVESLIHEEGGTLVYRETDERAGPEWVAYRYFVKKSY